MLGVYDSFVSTTQDTKENKTDEVHKFFGSRITSKKNNGVKKYPNYHKNDHFRFTNCEFNSINSKNMKRTDGFRAFRPCIGANSSNSLLPSSSGDTIANK